MSSSAHDSKRILRADEDIGPYMQAIRFPQRNCIKKQGTPKGAL